MNSPSPASEPALVQQLRQSLGMLQVAFDAAVESMLIIDGDRRVHWANQSSATLLVDGVPIQVMNRCLDSLMTFHLPEGPSIQHDHPLHPSQHLPLKEGEECLELSLSSGVRTTARQVRWQPVAILHARDHLLITIRDLSPEQRALLQQQRFMTDLTHELRTPLTIISGSLMRLRRASDPHQRAHRHLIRAEEETLRIHRLLEHLSLMTRLEVDPAWLGARVQPLLPVLRQWFEGNPDDRQQRLSIDWGGLSATDLVRIDANALAIVLDQLVENAVQHGADAEKIRMTVRCSGSSDGDSCALQVSSSGSGEAVGRDTLDDWLLPFVRSAGRRNETIAEGAGLGLAIVNRLVQSWGGSLQLEQGDDPNEPLFTVTSVSFTMPLTAMPLPSAAQEVEGRDPV